MNIQKLAETYGWTLCECPALGVKYVSRAGGSRVLFIYIDRGDFITCFSVFNDSTVLHSWCESPYSEYLRDMYSFMKSDADVRISGLHKDILHWFEDHEQ